MTWRDLFWRGDHESRRVVAGNAAPADFENLGARRANARVRNRALDPANFRGRAAGGRGIPVSGAAADADQGLGEGRMGRDGGESARALLPADGGRQEAVRDRNVAIRAGDSSDWESDSDGIARKKK